MQQNAALGDCIQNCLMTNGRNDRRRRALAAILWNGGILRSTVIGELSEIVAQLVGLHSHERKIVADVATGLHLSLRRGFHGDAQAIVGGASIVVVDPSHYSRLSSSSRFLLARTRPEGGAVQIIVKLVPASRAASGVDELWLVTGFLLNAKKLAHYEKRGTLIARTPVVEPQDAPGIA